MFTIDSLDIKTFPIIIFASPRTGCSLLGDLLAEKYSDLTYFNEPFSQSTLSEEFVSYASSTNLYILKTMSFDIHREYREHHIPEKIDNDITQPGGFKIRIRRQNLAEQVASNYVATKRKQFMYNKFNVIEFNLEQQFLEEIIPISIRDVYISINNIKRKNLVNDNLQIQVDLDLWYEDLDGLESQRIMKTPRPANYTEILETIRNYL